MSLQEDQEMAAQMAFFKNTLDSITGNQESVFVDISRMKLGYDSKCDPVLRLNG